jgi:ribonuclease BN (tRNA processing enzyme)
MTNSIIFLGTGGDSIVVGKQLRASGGIVLQLEDNQFLLDPGPGCLVMAKQANINIRETVGVFVSHAHTNHSDDINSVLEALSVSGLDRIGVLVASKKVINGDEKEIPALKKRSHEFVERVLDVGAGTRIGINSINIHTTKAQHYDTESIGFLFETPKYKIGYTADTEYTEEIAQQYKDCQILIINCKYPLEEKGTGHLSTIDVIEFLKKAKPRLAVITHFGIKMLQADPMFQAREIQRASGVEVLAATDGLTINPMSFAGKMKQESLDDFKK